MPIEDSDWRKIYKAINDSQPPPTIVQGEVVKADPLNNLIWLSEFGDQPIPLFMFDFTVKYYDTQPTVATGSASPYDVGHKVVPKTTKVLDVKIKCPKVGDTVLVLKQYGTSRLPKCIGVLQSKNFLLTEGTT